MDQLLTTDQLTIAKAKDLYTRKLKTARISQSQLLFGIPNWEKAREHRDRLGNVFIQTPLEHKKTIITVSSNNESTEKKQSINTTNEIPARQLILYQKESGEFQFRIMEITPNQNIDLKKGDLLSGEINYYDLETQRLLDGFRYDGGKPVTFFRTSNGRDLLSDKNAKKLGYQYIHRLKCFYVGSHSTYYSENGYTVFGHFEYSQPYQSCPPSTSGYDQYGQGIRYAFQYSEDVYETVWVDDGSGPPPGSGDTGGGGGGGNDGTGGNTGTGYVYPFTDVNNNLNNPCMSSAYYKILNSLPSLIQKIVNNYARNSDFRVDIANYDFGPGSESIDGRATPSTVTGFPNTIWTIELNDRALANASEQYIGVTIAHEFLHVYFNNTQKAPWDKEHNDMVSYIGSMAETIRLSYPIISQADATALAWGGLQGRYVVSWNAGLTPEQKNQIINTNNTYKDGTSGTKCP